MFFLKTKNSIREFFIKFILLSVMLPLSLLGGTALIISINALKAQLIEANMHQLNTISNNIELYLSDPLEELSSIKTILKTDSSLKQSDFSLVLQSITESHDFIIGVQVANKNGTLLYVYPDNASMIGTDVSGHEYFSETNAKNKPYWAPSFMSNLIDTPVSAFSIPWDHGVITAFVSLKQIVDLAFVNETEKYRKQILVTDQQGVFIAHPDHNKVLLREHDPLFRHCQNIWKGKPFTDRIEYLGEDFFSQVIFIPDTGWKLAVNQSSDALYSPLKAMAVWLTALTASVLLLAIYLGNKLSVEFTGPLTNLVDSTQVISTGNYELKLPTMKFNEFSKLSESFQRMADNVRLREEELKKHRNHLEEMVQSRTQELSASNTALEKEKELVEAANKAKSAFLTNMSHELRTPLNAVLGYSEILASREQDPQNKSYLQSIQSSGNALLSLINDVLDLAKIESGKQTLEKKVVSISTLFKEIDSIFRGKIAEKDIEFQVETAANLPECLLLDEVKLRQVLINLIGNSLKFTNSGFISLNCSLNENSHEEDSLVDLIIDVKDTGKGISPEDSKIIFGTFDQASGQKTSDFGGTGLGLAICKNMVELMDGTIELTSQLGQWTLFRINLPDIETTTIDLHEESNNNHFSPDDIIFDAATVLVAEDIDYNRDMIAAFLENYDFKIHFAVNGAEAIVKSSEIKPDIILMDLKMPKMDGLEASQILKNDQKTASPPIIMISASARIEDEKMLLEVVDGYLTKPVSQIKLLQEMAKHLRHKFYYPVQESEDVAQVEIIPPDNQTLENLSELSQDGDIEGIRKSLLKISKDQNYILFCTKAMELVDRYDDVGLYKYIQNNING